MSGVTGFFCLDGQMGHRNTLEEMSRTLTHRGPSGDGFYLHGAVGLGHRHLDVIDRSSPPRQPLSNQNETIWIALDGEIYNYQEFRSQLEAQGHRFATDSCAEAIIHGYEEYGLACLQKLSGMFAFALWDSERQRLWLARDRMGIRPMFYAMTKEAFLFGSEIKALLAHPALQARINYDALNLFFSIHQVLGHHTLFEGIHQLLPGQFLTISSEDPQPELETYWDIPSPTPRFKGSPNQAAERLLELLEDSVRVHSSRGAPLGSWLDGKLQSTVLALGMTRVMGNNPVRTFAIGFEEQNTKQLRHARRTSLWLNTRHTEHILSPKLLETLPKIAWHTEEPAADPSTVLKYHLAQLARQDVAVVLDGAGCEELLAGPPSYEASMLSHRLQMLPRSLFNRLKRSAGSQWQEAQNTRRLTFSENDRNQIFELDLQEDWDRQALQRISAPYISPRSGIDPLDRMLYVDARHFLPNRQLMRVDRMGMAHGLEVRLPMLDPELVGFAVSLPPEQKWKRKTDKLIIRQAMTRLLPDNLVDGPGNGADVSLSAWLDGPLHDFTRDTLSPRSIRATGFLSADGVQKLLSDHSSGSSDRSHQLWDLLMLMVWWTLFFGSS